MTLPKKYSDLAVDVLGDIASMFGFPTGTVSGVLRDFIRTKEEIARDVLLDEMRKYGRGERTHQSTSQCHAAGYDLDDRHNS